MFSNCLKFHVFTHAFADVGWVCRRHQMYSPILTDTSDDGGCILWKLVHCIYRVQDHVTVLKNTTTKASNKTKTHTQNKTSTQIQIIKSWLKSNGQWFLKCPNFKGILLQIQVYVINIRTDRGLSKNAFFFLQYISNDLSVMSLWNIIHVLLVSRFYKYKHALSTVVSHT